MMFTPGGQLDLLTFAGVRGGGGKGSGFAAAPIAPTTYNDPVTGKVYTTPEALNTAVDARTPAPAPVKTPAQIAQEEADAKTAAHNTWVSTVRDPTNARERNNLIDAFKRAGIADPVAAGYGDEIDAAMANTSGRAVGDDANYASLFDPNLGDTIVNTALGTGRTAATNALDAVFTPNYADTNLSNTIMDPYVNPLLDEQFNPLSTQLTNAQKRGTLTDTGYTAANDLLGTRRTTGEATVRDLGRSILSNDRTGLNDYISSARTTAGALNLPATSTFSADPYKAHAEGMINDYTGSFGGDLRNAVGNTKFTDLTELLNAGGAVQGATNAPATGAAGGGTLGGSIIEDDKKRGLGSTGAF